MKNIITFFTSKIFIAIIGLTILSLLVWFFGPAFKFGENNTAPLAEESTRLMTIIVMALLFVLNHLRVKLKEKQSNNSLVNDLQSAQD